MESNGEIHTYVWLKEQDFVVIFQRMDNGTRRLITSFYIDHDGKRDDLARKYANRIGEEEKRDAQTASPSPSALTPVRDGQ